MDSEGRVLVEATVVSIGEGPFYYPACQQCYSKITHSLRWDDTLYCYKCKINYTETDVSHRYRMCLTICDRKTLASVTAFGHMLAPFFGCSATELHKKWIEPLNRTCFLQPSSVIKCALEKTLMGNSLLFGFKGDIRKPKGSRIFLKDITDCLSSSTAQVPTWKNDLVAFQIVPQNPALAPIPVTHHLARVKELIQNKGENFNYNSNMMMSESFVKDILYDLSQTDFSQEKEDFPVKGKDNVGGSGDKENSDQQMSLISTLGENTSIDFTMSGSTPSALFTASLQVSNHATSGVDGKCFLSPVAGKRQRNLNITPLSSYGSSWCMRRWQKSCHDCGNNLAVDVPKERSKNGHNPPHKAQINRSNKTTWNASISSSTSKLVSSDLSSHKFVDSNEIPDSSEILSCTGNGNISFVDSRFVTQRKIQKKNLTLKESKNESKYNRNSLTSKFSVSKSNNIRRDHLSPRVDLLYYDQLSNSTLITCHPVKKKSFLQSQYPPCDASYCHSSYLNSKKNINYESLKVSPNKSTSKRPRGYKGLGDADFTNSAVLEKKESESSLHTDMPESEDLDLFLACADLEGLRISPLKCDMISSKGDLVQQIGDTTAVPECVISSGNFHGGHHFKEDECLQSDRGDGEKIMKYSCGENSTQMSFLDSLELERKSCGLLLSYSNKKHQFESPLGGRGNDSKNSSNFSLSDSLRCLDNSGIFQEDDNYDNCSSSEKSIVATIENKGLDGHLTNKDLPESEDLDLFLLNGGELSTSISSALDHCQSMKGKDSIIVTSSQIETERHCASTITEAQFDQKLFKQPVSCSLKIIDENVNVLDLSKNESIMSVNSTISPESQSVRCDFKDKNRKDSFHVSSPLLLKKPRESLNSCSEEGNKSQSLCPVLWNDTNEYSPSNSSEDLFNASCDLFTSPLMSPLSSRDHDINLAAKHSERDAVSVVVNNSNLIIPTPYSSCCPKSIHFERRHSHKLKEPASSLPISQFYPFQSELDACQEDASIALYSQDDNHYPTTPIHKVSKSKVESGQHLPSPSPETYDYNSPDLFSSQ